MKKCIKMVLAAALVVSCGGCATAVRAETTPTQSSAQVDSGIKKRAPKVEYIGVASVVRARVLRSEKDGIAFIVAVPITIKVSCLRDDLDRALEDIEYDTETKKVYVNAPTRVKYDMTVHGDKARVTVLSKLTPEQETAFAENIRQDLMRFDPSKIADPNWANDVEIRNLYLRRIQEAAEALAKRALQGK